jgi:RIO-like serine/threonine protein kinase
MNSTDCLSVAHQDTYNAKILHCNFSPGNIIIGSDRRGLLIDWDLSKPLSIVPETPRRATQTVHAKIDIRSLQ